MRRDFRQPLTWTRLLVPRDNHSAPFTAEQLYAALHAAATPEGHIELCLVGRPRDVGIYLRCTAAEMPILGALVLATYPDAELHPCESPLLPHINNAGPPSPPADDPDVTGVAATRDSRSGDQAARDTGLRDHAPRERRRGDQVASETRRRDVATDPAAVVAHWALAANPAYPIKTVREFDNSEPMAMTLGALAEARDGEVGLLSLRLRRAPSRARSRGLLLARRLERGDGEPDPWWLRVAGLPAGVVSELVAAASGPRSQSSLPPAADQERDAQVKAILGKAAQPLFDATLTSAWVSPDHARARAAHATLAAALGQFTSPAANALRAVRSRVDARAWAELIAPPPNPPRRAPNVLLGLSELAGMLHMPGPDLVVPYLARTGGRRREPRQALPPGALDLLRSTHRDRDEPVGVEVGTLLRHAYVLGPSGTGKTTLLARLVLELARQRTAAVVLDPHGDLTQLVLERLPDEDLRRTRLVDLTDPSNVPLLNPLYVPETSDPRRRALDRAVRVAAVTGVFTDLWRLSRAATPNLLHFLDAALAALVAHGRTPLAELPRFLTDAGFRAQVIRDTGDERVAARWQEFALLSSEERSRTVRAILNKAAAFDRNPLLATVFGDPGPGLRLDDTMDHAGLLLVSLPRGLVPEGTVSLLGSLLVTQLHQAALAREARASHQRAPVVAVIDEFQEFALSAFAQVVTATRKYGLGLVVANQNLSRIAALDPDVLSTLLANVATLGAFRLAAEDAERLQPHLAPLAAADLANLQRYECYWRTLDGGAPQPVVSARSLPLPPPRRTDDEIRALAGQLRVPGAPLQVPASRTTDEANLAEAW